MAARIDNPFIPRPIIEPLPRQELHAEAASSARGDLVGGGAGKIRVESLDNGAHLVIAERPGAERVRVQVGIAAGSLQDPEGKLGAAHLLEHLAFEGSSKRTGDQQEKLRTELGGAWNAYTTPDRVVYYGVAPAEQSITAANLITEMFREPALDSRNIKQEKAAVENEMIYRSGGVSDMAWHVEQRLNFGDQPHTELVGGTRKTVDAIEPKDLKAFHKQYYTGRNTVALVEGPPDSLPIDTLRRELGKLPAGSRVTNADLGRGIAEGQALQLIRDSGDKSVNISVSVPFASDEIDAPKAAGPFVAQLQSVLHDRLRRIDHATYGVSANLTGLPDGDAAALTVRTTVPRGKAQEATERIIETLKDSRDGFGPKRFETMQKSMIAAARMNEPTKPDVSERAQAQFDDLLADPAADNQSALMELFGMMRRDPVKAVKSVTYEDVAAVGESMINLDNLKVLAVGNVGDGREIRAGLRQAGIDTGKMASNPVDMSVYRQMGLAVE